MKKLTFFFLFITFVLAPTFSHAQDTGNWTIEQFNSIVKVNNDSSLTITEEIAANCADCADKHGIFRILPTQARLANGQTIKTPIHLKSITDYNNQPIPYDATPDYINHTITWKIGDPNQTVTGLNDYKIVYTVDNAIRFGNKNYDELYWNLLGNFWDIPIQSFVGTIILPNSITEQNTNTNYYTGSTGSKNNNLASYTWPDTHTIQFQSTRSFKPNQGITVSLTFPKNIIAQPAVTFLDLYGQYLWLIIPFLSFLIGLWTWHRFGRDPKLHRTVVPEFTIPENLSPIAMGMLENNGYLRNSMITAGLVNLAVNKIIKIKAIPKVGLFGQNDYQLNLINDKAIDPLDKLLIKKVFNGKKEILISDLKNKFYESISDIEELGRQQLIDKKLIVKYGFVMQNVFLIFGFFLIVIAIILNMLFYNLFNPYWLSGSVVASGLIFFLFAPLMKQRTMKGTLLLEKVRGFELYIKTAEKYRQQFNEKENIFEKFLPYAMLFNLTEIWVKNMRSLYGEKYFSGYVPTWFILNNTSNFNLDSFSSEMNNISSSIGQAVSSPSGSGGGGFAGGGSGGGGGGGW